MKTTKEAILPLILITLYFFASVAPNYMKPRYRVKTDCSVEVITERGSFSK